MSGLFDKIQAVIRRDVLTASRYPLGIATQVVGVVAELVGLFYLAKAIGPQYKPGGIDYYPFLVLGTGFYQFFMMSVSTFATTVREAQVTGVMEVLMTTATPAPMVMTLSALAAMFTQVLKLIAFIVFGFLLFPVTISAANWGAVLLLMLLTIIIALSLGILVAAVQVGWQKSGAIVWVVGSTTWLLSGTMFPITALPGPLRKLALVLPITHSLNGLRAALLNPSATGVISQALAVLAIYALALAPLCTWIFAATVDRARRRGTLSYY